MDIQLQELIDKIKSEGVKTAEEKAEEIIQEAEKKAASIVADAEAKASDIREKAKEAASRFETSGKEALKQAGRDVVLSTRKELLSLFDKVLEAETEKVLKGNFLESSIESLIKNWKPELEDYTLLVPDAQLEELSSGLKSKLAEELRKGLEIKPVAGIKSGFRVSSKNGSVYYDFTSKGLSEILSELLNPRIGELLRDASAGEA